MAYIVVDVESDGPIPSKYSMISFGAVIVDEKLDKTFYGKTKPISNIWIPEALAISNISRDVHETYDDPVDVMKNFIEWIKANSKGPHIFISDNLAYDWQFINFYMHMYAGENPFGFSGRRIGDIYCGMKNNMNLNREWKQKYRKTKHTHHPVDDAKGNAEALLEFSKLGLKIHF